MKRTALCMIVLTILLTCTNALADSPPPPKATSVELENGDKIFFFSPPGFEDGQPQTGLYYNTDPPEVIYLVQSVRSYPLYFDDNNTFLSSNGIHFAFFPLTFHNGNVPGTPDWQPGQEDTNEYTASAVEFFANGQLIKRYTVSDLVKDNSKLSFSVSMIMWESWLSMETGWLFDPEENTLTIGTVDGRIYTFDITTGDIISEDFDEALVAVSPYNERIDDPGSTIMGNEPSASNTPNINNPVIWILIGALCLILVASLTVVIIRRKHTKKAGR